MSRFFFLIYGGIAYLLFLATFLYTVGFTTNLFVPKTISGHPELPWINALLNNLVLLGIFAIQHSVMARKGFKKWWTQVIPDPIERSTYVLFSSLVLILLIWKWQPMGGVIWSLSSPFLSGLLVAVSLLGYTLILASSFMIDHFDFVGLRQVWRYFRNQSYEPLKFTTAYLYKYVRHPLYLGFIIGAWATPVMTTTHLTFAVIITAYTLVGIYFEEKDLVNFHGKVYSNYQSRIPKLIPGFRKKELPRETPVPVSDRVA
ncbi:methanethiol S-methyltransferase [Flavilitoribacter nigricans]|uniref:methanethiol S-methyltransferase n=1 Tax=Flavilitoribacter nigricans (strain ATCC 23147 / DSM 23189 / NBRC 102662 / NCIMB 1420 / SS-2) TaxID=1122177 RepID=A0A2D0NHI3_FLAN2|nr:methanethiol S-methyltransferase [Flavilitoribacter nigricans]PHN07941.1 hypothetical protein CRP01_04075 [Flavilitoribacter nigricans DSM 23189 = NBRC 102662]